MRDDAADASRFFSRIGYLVLAVGAPVGVVLHPLGLYVMFSIGVGLILIAAALDAEPGFFGRFRRPFFVPAFLALLAGLVWAALSILWTPYPVAAAQLLLKLGVLLVATMLAVAAPRENAAATDLYLFPIGVIAGMATMVARALARDADSERRTTAGSRPARSRSPCCCSRRSAGLAARGRNGLARLLLIVALCFAYIASYTPLTVALFAGYLALSFSISDLSRTARELSWGAAALILLSPLIPALAPTVSAWIFHARLGFLAGALSVALGGGGHFHPRQAEAHHRPWICDGQPWGSGPDLAGATPRARSPSRSGTSLASSAPCWRRLGHGLRSATFSTRPPRLAPYMAAAFSAVVALAFLNVDFAEMTTLTLIAVAVISTDVAARSQYRTSRPSAARLANL